MGVGSPETVWLAVLGAIVGNRGKRDGLVSCTGGRERRLWIVWAISVRGMCPSGPLVRDRTLT